MEVHLPENQEAQLNDMAHAEWFKAQVQVGMDQIQRGEYIEEDEMDSRIERMLRR
jgi:predicted transcriptional regulator